MTTRRQNLIINLILAAIGLALLCGLVAFFELWQIVHFASRAPNFETNETVWLPPKSIGSGYFITPTTAWWLGLSCAGVVMFTLIAVGFRRMLPRPKPRGSIPPIEADKL